MSKKQYPCIGSDSPMKGNKQCDCCKDGIAVRKVEFQTGWFRGDDEVFKLCLIHYPLAKSGDLDVLMQLAEVEKARRRALNGKAVLKPVAIAT
jgi:hypothetical protein